MQKLFKHSSFFCIKKDEECNHLIRNGFAEYDSLSRNFHPKRKREFFQGRVCAHRAHLLLTSKDPDLIAISDSRAPIWPENIVGSITHNDFWVGAAVATNDQLTGVGIDFEVMGKVQPHLKNQIIAPGDLLIHKMLTDSELLTMIFSMKESFFKALYPEVKKYFSFQDAIVREINMEEETFIIELLTKLNNSYGPDNIFSFEGRFNFFNESCLTAIEILKH
jgi:enterobactin synthetase component D